MRRKGEIGPWQQKWQSEVSIVETNLHKPAIDILNGCDKDIYPFNQGVFHTLLKLPIVFFYQKISIPNI